MHWVHQTDVRRVSWKQNAPDIQVIKTTSKDRRTLGTYVFIAVLCLVIGRFGCPLISVKHDVAILLRERNAECSFGLVITESVLHHEVNMTDGGRGLKCGDVAELPNNVFVRCNCP